MNKTHILKMTSNVKTFKNIQQQKIMEDTKFTFILGHIETGLLIS